MAQTVKCLAYNAGDLGSIPESGRSPGEGKGYPLQYSGLEISMDCVSPWGHKQLDTTERLSLSLQTKGIFSRNISREDSCPFLEVLYVSLTNHSYTAFQ